ncbi:MAG: acyl-CoA dehydratase activase [Candidatus Eremiobacteraeota bacterium]|nr:acyl-CoA dehydratase activase [Candidatus Eremiobacteraeota bacterium]
MERAVGICLGASTLGIVEVKNSKGKIRIGKVITKTHEGNPMAFLKASLDEVGSAPLTVTGRKFRNLLDLPQITEVEAIEEALRFTLDGKVKPEAAVSAGSETFIIYLLDKDMKVRGIHTGSKCASGTGEFFLQQLRRMNVTPEEAISKALDVDPYKISGRCSVFCKSDCTHALNRGEPIGHIAAGLCEMMAKKIIELLPGVSKRNIVLLGGVSRNRAVVKILKKDIENLIIPKEAPFFEALGAALWAYRNCVPVAGGSFFKEAEHSFDFLPPLSQAEHLVTFKKSVRGKARKSDKCLVGLDVGSTTTKAVLMRISDNAILASCYLRTNGDPIGASKKCFEEIDRALPCEVTIKGLGVTGSGRYISALYAETDAIINEIIAHAEAALYFDPAVDTIFEIGGQDAKYTYLQNGVPCDYAMNEACSAGTGSFLEESAKESLGVAMEDIAALAMKSRKPPNFNDQCAAFIGSDIKSAIQEGIPVEDIIAGLVYSICMNYNNKVKGPRTAGTKIFMQGGVCYNSAVPVAMAALIGSSIVVPPEPGLMGAFGVALEVKRRQSLGLLGEKSFSLKELVEKRVEYGKTFTCKGGEEQCDRKCSIQLIKVKDKNFPFGGACNRYYNMQLNRKEEDAPNLVKDRYSLLTEKLCTLKPPLAAPTLGLNRSFLTHLLYPLYYNFFTLLGFRVVLPDTLEEEGIEQKGAYFCHPLEAAHGYYLDLLRKKPEVIVLPHVREISVPKAVSTKHDMQATCHLLQSETYCLRESFSDLEKDIKVLRPIFDFSQGYESEKKSFIKLARDLGKKGKLPGIAFDFAMGKQQEFFESLKILGRIFLQELEENPRDKAVVIFGRPYNAFTPDMNMGIPEKFSSRGIPVISFDMLPYDDEPVSGQMHWGIGQMLMKAALFVKKHRQLYGAYITNFSCGPDSFLQRYFREIMGRKPSLTIELDSHTADAGITTRVEAFLDIVDRYRKLNVADDSRQALYSMARTIVTRDSFQILTSENELISPRDPRVHLLLPSMGWLLTEAAGAAFESMGFKTTALPQPDFEVLKMGRANTSCKECLPLILITGMLEKYLSQGRPEDELTMLFVPKAEGGCRLGQYCVFLENHIEKKELRDVAILALDNENNYAGFGDEVLKRVVQGMIISDIMDDIYSAIYALSKDRAAGLASFHREWNAILDAIRNNENLDRTLEQVASRLREIELKKPIHEACKVLLCGEIYVRKERFASGPIIKALGDREIVVKTAQSNEWLLYNDYLISAGVLDAQYNLPQLAMHHVKHYFKNMLDTRYKKILARSGLFEYEKLDINRIMEYGKKLLSIYIGGDPILSCGSSLKDILHTISGVVLIGPFACMQSRITEAVLSKALTCERKIDIEGRNYTIPESINGLPFLAIETDGNIFPQILEAKIEAFALQSQRIHNAIAKEPAGRSH